MEDRKTNETVEKQQGAVDINAYDRQFEALNEALKEKDRQIEHHVKRWQFYESIVKSLTTFK